MKESQGKRETTMPEREVLIAQITAAAQVHSPEVQDAAKILSSKRLGIHELKAALLILKST